MEINRTIYKENCNIHYTISDNICLVCAHNPSRYNAYNKHLDGKCKRSNKDVIECCDFAKYGSCDNEPIIGYSKLSDIKE